MQRSAPSLRACLPEHHLVWIECTAVIHALPFWPSSWHNPACCLHPTSRQHAPPRDAFSDWRCGGQPCTAQTARPTPALSLHQPIYQHITPSPSNNCTVSFMPVQELPLPAKVPSDVNLFELRDASARNITNGASVVLLANFDEYNTTRLCMERTIGSGLVLLRCTAQPGNQLWTRMPSE